jgi:hypothetical protein
MVPAMSLRASWFFASAVLAAACTKDGAAGGGGNAQLEARVKKLEADNAKYKEMLEMIYGNFQQQKKQQEEEEANEAAPDAVFAVDITGNQIEGPASGAYVTIIEAWDFA